MRAYLATFILAWLVLAAPVSVLAQASPPFAATVISRANLRGGPGTTYPVVGAATAGQVVQVAECNSDCSWYKLAGDVWIAAFLVEPVTAPALLPTATPTANPRPYTMPDLSTLTAAEVATITDGDTIRVVVGGRNYPVRYIGVNTPEVGQPYADQATALNRALVAGETVYLEKDVSETDRYQRLLRYVWLANGTLVNHEMVRLGYAQAATYPPDVKYEALYLEAQRAAMAEGLGLWAESASAAPAPTATPVPAVATGPTANRNANLREGPGTNYAVVGSVSAGQALQIMGRTSATDWYQLANGAWIAAFLVNNAPTSLPVVAAPSAPTAVPVDTGTRSDPVVVPVATPVPPPPTAVPTPVEQPKCDPNYTGACIPLVGYDLDCGDVSARRFQSIGSDPHGFDRDQDGISCES